MKSSIYIFLLLVTSISLFAQKIKSEKTDTIYMGSSKYPTHGITANTHLTPTNQ